MRRALTTWRALLAIGSAAVAVTLCFVASALARPWSPRVADRFAYRGFAFLAKGERAAATAGIGLVGTGFASLAGLGVDELARTRTARLDRLVSQGRDGVRKHAVAPLLRRVAVTSVVLAVALAAATAAIAWWTSTATISGNLISTGSWTECASLDPGTSTAVHWYTRKRRAFYHVLPIAGIDSSGSISLDFGDVVPRNSNASPDVFRVTGGCQRTFTVTFSLEGAAAGLISTVRFADDDTLTVSPGQTRSVYIKLNIPKTALGEYRGTLVMAVDGTSERHELPMLITVRTAPRAAEWTLLGAATPMPTTSGEPETPASTSPSPSAEPSSSPWSPPSPSPALQVRPGPATAQILNPSTGALVGEHPVAIVAADGSLNLDLGGVRAGESRAFDGALILASSGFADLPLAFLVEGDASGLVAEVVLLGRKDSVLPAGASTGLRLAVTVPVGAAPGASGGVLLFSSGEAILLRIPFVISVWTAAGTPSASPQTATSASASPLPSPSGSAD